MRKYLLLLLFLLPLKGAYGETLSFARYYTLSWGGMQVGYMAAEIRPLGNQEYRFEVRIYSNGPLKWISQYQSRSMGRFRIKENGEVIPLSFENEGYLRNKHRSTSMVYDEGGTLLSEVLSPPKKSWKNPDVPKTLLKNTHSPLSLAIAAREHSKTLKEKQSVSLPMYDGKHLARYRFVMRSQQEILIKKQSIPVRVVQLSRTPVAGFSKNELKALPKEPVIDLYFQNNALFLPVKAEAKLPIGGKAVIVYDHDCTSLANCVR